MVWKPSGVKEASPTSASEMAPCTSSALTGAEAFSFQRPSPRKIT